MRRILSLLTLFLAATLSGAEAGRSAQTENGFDEVRRASDGVLLERREKTNVVSERFPAIAASWAHDGGANKAAHLNLRYAPGHFTLQQFNHVTPASAPARDDRLTQDSHPTRYEIGGDITRPLGSGALKLIGLANRRELFSSLDRMIAASRRSGRPVSVAVLDIDRFKLVNDTHGHPAGDEVIRRISEMSRLMMRDQDLVGRLGGEEFVVVVSARSAEMAALQVNVLRQRLSAAVRSAGLARSALHLSCHRPSMTQIVSITADNT